MKILVAVAQALELPEQFALTRGLRSVESDALEWNLTDSDRTAIESGLELRHGGELVVVTIGPGQARDGLLAALALGADRALHVVHPAPEDLDPIAAGRVLASLIEREAPDLVISGGQGPDAAVAVAAAAFLGLPRVAGAGTVEAGNQAGTLRVERVLEDGLIEELQVRMPAVLTVHAGARAARYADLPGIRQAFAKPLESLTAEDASGVSGAQLVSLSRPTRGAGAEMIDGDAEVVAARIASIVKSEVS